MDDTDLNSPKILDLLKLIARFTSSSGEIG